MAMSAWPAPALTGSFRVPSSNAGRETNRARLQLHCCRTVAALLLQSCCSAGQPLQSPAHTHCCARTCDTRVAMPSLRSWLGIQAETSHVEQVSLQASIRTARGLD